jgi:hypothetical protein
MPSGKPDYTVPPPPASRRSCRRSAPRRPSGSTEPIRSRRRFRSPNTSGPLVRPENAANENNNDPDRPWGVTLLTPDDPLTAISAVPLLHFPDDAPILYVTRQGIPKVTENELKRFGDTGISLYRNVDAFQVGAAANPAVERDLKTMGVNYATVTAPNVPALANTVDKLYGQIENPDGRPQHATAQ